MYRIGRYGSDDGWLINPYSVAVDKHDDASHSIVKYLTSESALTARSEKKSIGG